MNRPTSSTNHRMSSPTTSPGMLQRYARWREWPCWLGLLAVAFSGIRTISHATFWTHLAAGRHIAQNGIPRVEPFTWAGAEQAWVDTSWLYDLLLYRLWSWVGAPGVTLLHIIMVVTAFYLLLDVARPLAGPLARGFALLLASWLTLSSFDVGSKWAGVLLAAIFLRILARPKGPPWQVAVWLIPLYILWVNLDASFLWGPVLVLVFSTEGFLRHTDESAAYAERAGIYLLLAPTLCVVSLLNPYGFDILPAVFTGGIPLQLENGGSPFSGLFPALFTRNLIYAILLLGAGGLLFWKKRLPLALTTIGMISAFWVVRWTPPSLPFFALFSFPFCALSLQAIGQRITERAAPANPNVAPANALRRIAVVLLLIGWTGSLAGWISNRYYVHMGHSSAFGFGAVESVYPSNLETVLNHPAFPAAVLNLPSDGGYLAWAYPHIKPFIDVRASAHGAQRYRRLLRGLMGDPVAWEELEERWLPQAVILTNHRPPSLEIGQHLRARPDWEPVYFNGTTTVWILATPERAELLAQRNDWLAEELATLEAARRTYQAQLGRWRRPPLPAPLLGAATMFHLQGQHAAAATCYALITQGAPNMSTAPLWWGINLTHLQQHAAATSVLQRALDRLPSRSDHAIQARLYLGINALEQGAAEEAVRSLRHVVNLQPEYGWAWLWLERAYQQAGRPAEARQARAQVEALMTDLPSTALPTIDEEEEPGVGNPFVP